MKNKILFVSILVAPLMLSSCSFSDIIDINPIKKVEIKDENDYYAYGDIYESENQLSILVIDRNGKTVEIDNSKLTIKLAVDGVEQAYNTAIENKGGAGKFTVTAIYNNIKSNVLEYDLISEHVYIDSLAFSGPENASTHEDVELNLAINPTNFTKKLTLSLSDSSMATVSRNGEKVFVKGLKPGSVDVIASSVNKSGVTVSAKHTMTFISTTPYIAANQTYNDYVKNNIYNVSSCPLTGSPNLLVIPVWFSDSQSFIFTSKREGVREDIQKAYFGNPDEIGWHSVSSYYYEESDGRLDLKGTVSDWYETSITASQAGDPDFDMGDLVTSAVDWYFSTTGDSKEKFDSDGDKVIDGIMLIYAAPDYITWKKSSYNNLWAYCFWLQPDPIPSGIYPNVYFWASYDFIYGNNTVTSRTGRMYYNGDTSHCDIDAHTYIHEMGHVFGLEDYYDYSGYKLSPAGDFSMQDYNVGGHDPYSVFAFGWANAYVPNDTATITISNFQDNHDLILLSPEFNTYRSPFDEYLLLELYSPTGLNYFDSRYSYQNIKGPQTSGIRLWHVDARLATPTSSFGDRFKLTDSNVESASSRYGVTHACSNTYDDGEEYTQDYLSVMGREYYNYNILQLIRNDPYETYEPSEGLVAKDLFFEGDSFSMNTYSKQFVKGTKLNNGKSLGWTFTVDRISNDTATITVTRA